MMAYFILAFYHLLTHSDLYKDVQLIDDQVDICFFLLKKKKPKSLCPLEDGHQGFAHKTFRLGVKQGCLTATTTRLPPQHNTKVSGFCFVDT